MNLSFKHLIFLWTLPALLLIAADARAQACPADPASEILAHRNPFLADLVAQHNFEKSLEQLTSSPQSTHSRKTTPKHPYATANSFVNNVDPLSVPTLDASKGVKTEEKAGSGTVSFAQDLPATHHHLTRSTDCRFADDDDPKNDICSDVVDTPISTGPALFTEYQAKHSANAVFSTLNNIFREIDEKLLIKHQKVGLAESTQPNSIAPPAPFNVVKDAVRLQRLLPPRLALTQYFGSAPIAGYKTHTQLPIQNRTCNAKDVRSASCERLPFDTPSGSFYSSSYLHAQAVTPSLDYLRELSQRLSKLDRQPLYFPDAVALWDQNIHEVALPPPKC